MQIFKYKLPKHLVLPICIFLYAKDYRLGCTDSDYRNLYSFAEGNYLEPICEYDCMELTNCIIVNHTHRTYEFLLKDEDENEDDVEFNLILMILTL